MQSLKDKLLKAGLVSEEQAKKVEAEKAQPKPPPQRSEASSPRPPPPTRSGPPRSDRPVSRGRPGPREASAPARLPKFAPLPGSKEAQRSEAKKQVQLDRFLREKVLATQVPIEPGATTFYFVTRKGKLRRLDLTDVQAKMLEEGKLAVVERPDPDRIEHALVPPEAAAELIAQSEKTVRFWNREGQAVGFLSEAEISSRHAEADEPESAEPAKAAEGETWITIKRA
jgi:uncharacterized protein YaiL (DUF2058 family)